MSEQLLKYCFLEDQGAVLGDKSKNAVYRFLGTDSEGGIGAIINMGYSGRKGRHAHVSMEALRSFIAQDQVVVMPELKFDEIKMTPAVEKFITKGWRDLMPFHGRCDYLFDSDLMGKLMQESALAAGCSLDRMRYLVRRNLQGGDCQVGLRCDYGRCGILKNVNFKKGKPAGRSTIVKGAYGGRRLTEEDKKKLDEGIKEYVLKPGEHNLAYYPDIFDLIIDEFFRVKEVVNGSEILVHESCLPTPDQFLNRLYRTTTKAQRNRSRKTPNQHATSDRSQLSQKKTLAVRGPGDIYQLDSTDGDIWLARYFEDEDGKLQRRAIGRPRLYLVRDVFSRLIVGFHFSLAGASWREAVCAIVNILEDKKAICERFKVPYDPADWPAAPLAENWVADRQELIHQNSEFLLSRLGTHISNPPAGRGDLKSLIEAGLGATNKINWSLPGGVDPKAGDDEEDYRRNASLTFEDFCAGTIEEIIKLNKLFYENLPLPPEASMVSKVPLVVFKWGRKEKSGRGLSLKAPEARRRLLNKVSLASARKDGIHVSIPNVSDVVYVCPQLEKECPDIFEGNGVTHLVGQYDDSSMNVVWLESPRTREVYPATLKQPVSDAFQDKSWYEGHSHQLNLKDQKADNKSRNLPHNSAQRDRLLARIGEAKDKATAATVTSRAASMADVSGHRAVVRQHLVQSRPKIDQPPVRKKLLWR